MTRNGTLHPANEVEDAIKLARAGRISIVDFIRILMDSVVCVPSETEVSVDMAELRPLVVDRGGTAMVAVFTSPSRAAKFGDKASYMLACKGREVLRRLKENIGLVVNPGFDDGLEISPRGIAEIKADFAA
ncbi:MAG: SseB family protein [Phycisphaerae bacterium]